MQNNDNQQTLVISYLTMRKVIGILGVALPVVLVIGTLINGDKNAVQDSISDYYHTGMRDAFVGILCMVALFLFHIKVMLMMMRPTSSRIILPVTWPASLPWALLSFQPVIHSLERSTWSRPGYSCSRLRTTHFSYLPKVNLPRKIREEEKEYIAPVV